MVTEVYGVSELNTNAAYGLPGHDKDKHKKSFRANPINAIVVTNQEDQRGYAPASYSCLISKTYNIPSRVMSKSDDFDLISIS